MKSDGVDALWAPLVDHGSSWCAPNIHADASWLDVDGEHWRVSFTQPARRNSYVVSATGQYLDYAKEELHRLPAPFVRNASRILLSLTSPMLRALDPVLILDALPLSTVLHPARSESQWAHALRATREAHPGYPIVVRSLDHVTGDRTLTQLRSLGLSLMPSRLVFHQDPRNDEFWTTRNLLNDIALIRRVPLACRALAPEDAEQIAALYWMLYGQKHSRLNPQLSPAWMAHGMASHALRGEGIEDDGRLVAVYLSYCVEGVMTNPVFGYDISLPQSLGLYRRLSVMALQAARRHGVLLHASSGAPSFKATRGGIPAIEYLAVDLSGARGLQRLAWQGALRVAQSIGPHMLRHTLLTR